MVKGIKNLVVSNVVSRPLSGRSAKVVTARNNQCPNAALLDSVD